MNFERYVINVFGLLFLFMGVRDSSGNAIREEWAVNQPNLRELVCVFGQLSQKESINPAIEGNTSFRQSDSYDEVSI